MRVDIDTKDVGTGHAASSSARRDVARWVMTGPLIKSSTGARLKMLLVEGPVPGTSECAPHPAVFGYPSESTS